METPIKWRGLFRVDKYITEELAESCGRVKPYDVVEAENLLLTAGATLMLQFLAGQGAPTAFNGTNGYMCIGNGTTAAVASQTDLQGATKTRKILDAAPVISGAGITFVTTFGTADANQAWEEAGLANASAAGVLLNRVVQTFGVKTSGLTWVVTGSISLV